MADTKVTSLPALTVVANEDILYVVDDPSGTPTSKKAALSDAMRVAYGRVYRTDAAVGFVLTSGVWANVDIPNTNGGVAVNVVENGASGYLTPGPIGVYLAHVTMSVFAPGKTTLRFRVTSNATAQAGEAAIQLEGSGNLKTVTLVTLVNQTGLNEILRIQCKPDASVTVQFQDCVLVATRVG